MVFLSSVLVLDTVANDIHNTTEQLYYQMPIEFPTSLLRNWPVLISYYQFQSIFALQAFIFVLLQLQQPPTEILRSYETRLFSSIAFQIAVKRVSIFLTVSFAINYILVIWELNINPFLKITEYRRENK